MISKRFGRGGLWNQRPSWGLENSSKHNAPASLKIRPRSMLMPLMSTPNEMKEDNTTHTRCDVSLSLSTTTTTPPVLATCTTDDFQRDFPAPNPVPQSIARPYRRVKFSEGANSWPHSLPKPQNHHKHGSILDILHTYTSPSSSITSESPSLSKC